MSVYQDKKAKGNRKKWIADVTMRHPDGTELRRKKRARTRDEANEAERALETQLRKELFTPELLEKPKAPLLKAFIPDFLAWYATVKKPSTAYTREHIIQKYLIPFAGEKRLDEITTPLGASLITYLRGRGLSVAQSLNNVTTALSVIMKRAKTLGLVNHVPHIEYFRPPKKEAKSLTEGQFAALLEVLPSAHWRVAALLSGVCGLRRGEVVALRWEDISLKDQLIHVKRSRWATQEGTPKNHEARFVPMTEVVSEALQALPEREGLVCRGVSGGALSKLLTKKKLDGCKAWHSLRHTALTRMGNTGTPIHILSKIAGHKDLSTTAIYLHTQHDDLIAAAEKLNGILPSGYGRVETTEGLAVKGGAEETSRSRSFRSRGRSLRR